MSVLLAKLWQQLLNLFSAGFLICGGKAMNTVCRITSLGFNFEDLKRFDKSSAQCVKTWVSQNSACCRVLWTSFVQSVENSFHRTTAVHLHLVSRYLKGSYQSCVAEQEPPSGPLRLAVWAGETDGSCAWCGHPTSPAAGHTKAPCSSFSCSGGGPCLCYCIWKEKQKKEESNRGRWFFSGTAVGVMTFYNKSSSVKIMIVLCVTCEQQLSALYYNGAQNQNKVVNL